MTEALAGLGLATSAGLNAYIPLLALAIGSRFSDAIDLPAGFAWLGHGWVLAILVVLFVIEEVVDKVPGLDHANDVVQSVVRPAAGAVVFAAQTTDGRFDRSTVVPLVIGAVIAFTMHGTKATARGAANVGTGGVAAPVLSVIEDVLAVIGSLIAILLPVLVLFFIAAVAAFAWWARRTMKARRTRRADRRTAARSGQIPHV